MVTSLQLIGNAPPVRTRPAEGRLPQSRRTDPDPARRKPLRHEARFAGVGLRTLPTSDFGIVESSRRELGASGRNAARLRPLPPSARSSFPTIQFSAESKTIDFAGLFANFRSPPNPNHHKFRALLFSRRGSARFLVIKSVGPRDSSVRATDNTSNPQQYCLESNAIMKMLKLGILNVKLHPHPEGIYQKLLEAAGNLGRDVKIQGNEYGCLGNIQPSGENENIVGVVQRFTELDRTAPWLNRENHEAVSPSSEEAPKIPPKFKPNYRSAMFSLYPKEHKIVFNAVKLKPNIAERFFKTVFNDPELVAQFGVADIVLVQSREGMSELLKRPEKSKIVIRILRPNGDDISDVRREILRRFENQRVRSFSQVLEAPAGEDLSPDKETRELMEVARTDGEVAVYSKRPGEKKKKESTKDHPFLVWEEVNPEANEVDEFEFAADRALLKLQKETRLPGETGSTSIHNMGGSKGDER